MTPSLDRLDRASDTLAETVVDRARDDLDLDLTTLEQLAYDVALDDPVLGDLCEMIEDLRQLGEERQRARDGDSLSRVEQRILSAGISIDDAILARIDRLADEIIESERDRMIDDSVQIMTDGGTCRDGIEPCVGCDETVNALYCSWTCMQEDDGRVLESPITDTLYYVTEWEDAGDGKFVAHEKQEIEWSDDTATERDRSARSGAE